MRIKSIKFIDHDIYGSTEFDFCDNNGNPVDTIILAGENGTGKSTLLNIIFEGCARFSSKKKLSSGKTIFLLEINDSELSILKRSDEFLKATNGYELDKELEISIDNSQESWRGVKPRIKRKNREDYIELSGIVLEDEYTELLFKSIYSDIDVNYKSNQITSTTSLDIDKSNSYSIRSTADLAQEITQLFIDIEALDNSDFIQWANDNPDSIVSEGDFIRDKRMGRFKNAFDKMFDHKKYKRVINTTFEKQILFEESGKTISINDLSSGEKQIVFRGSFLLRDKLSTEGAIALIDEPEISLHPNWQMKILDFYKNLFVNEQGIQTSQIFVATHSPFVIHNENRSNDKVLILKKNDNKGVCVTDQGQFFNWTHEETVKEAFNINLLQTKIQNPSKHLIITEGKTDWKHLRRAHKKFKQYGLFNSEDWEFEEYEDVQMGHSHLSALCEQVSKIRNNHKIICIFDRDVKEATKKAMVEGKDYKSWGNNVYSFVIPVPSHRDTTPDIAIEHYYTDNEIKTVDANGRRLYIGSEFNGKLGHHIDNKEKICLATKKKLGEGSISIIDSEVFLMEAENNNIALSKNQFAENILKDIAPYDQIGFENFKPIFEIIERIINEK